MLKIETITPSYGMGFLSREIAMKTYVLRINFNNLKPQIDSNYFLYKDVFYKCFIASMYNHYINNKQILNNILIDNSHYWQYFINAVNINQTLESMLYELNLDRYVYIFLDMNIYLEEFFNMKHMNGVLNIYSLDITDTYNVEIKNKQIREINADKNFIS